VLTFAISTVRRAYPDHVSGRASARRVVDTPPVAIGIGVLGLGSVFWGPYRQLIERLAREGRVRLTAVYDTDLAKRQAVAGALGLDPDLTGPDALLARDDVDLVLVLASMPAHGPLTLAALEAGKHVLVEKPMATTLADAERILERASAAPGTLVCAPHILLSPTYRLMHERVCAGAIGRVLTARGRYGWSGPWWNDWYYRRGGGALFDLGIYNITSLCGFLGPARRVSAFVGTAIPERVVDGETIRVEADDNAHVLLDFGESRFAVVTTGFTMQRYRSPALELYGTDGVLQMLGDDWAPAGFEQWRNAHGAWELFPEPDPLWSWTDGLRHLVDCLESGRAPVIRPEHAFHALEIALAAMRSSAEGRAVAIESPFPEPDYASLPALAGDERRVHDPRTG
jgi:predicted dehydrogenase